MSESGFWNWNISVKEWMSSATVASMSVTAEGIYLRLCMVQVTQDGCCLPSDQGRLQRICRATDDEWAHFAEFIDEVFPLCEDGKRRNPRVFKDWLKSTEKSQKNTEAIRKRWEGSIKQKTDDQPNPEEASTYGRNTDVIRTNNGRNTDVIPINNQESSIQESSITPLASLSPQGDEAPKNLARPGDFDEKPDVIGGEAVPENTEIEPSPPWWEAPDVHPVTRLVADNLNLVDRFRGSIGPPGSCDSVTEKLLKVFAISTEPAEPYPVTRSGASREVCLSEIGEMLAEFAEYWKSPPKKAQKQIHDGPRTLANWVAMKSEDWANLSSSRLRLRRNLAIPGDGARHDPAFLLKTPLELAATVFGSSRP